MAEFCLECINKINNKNYSERKYILSDYPDLCENCGCYKRVVIIERKAYYLHKFRYILFPVIGIVFLVRLLVLPILLFIRIKQNKKIEFPK